MGERLQRSLRMLLQLEDTPHRLGLAFGIGLYIAFFPIWGIHTLMALGLASLLRLSRAAMVLGAWLNNPWTAAPFYAAGTVLGCWLLGVPAAGLASFSRLAEQDGLLGALRPYLWPFVVGNTVVGVVLGAAGYLGLRLALERRARRRAGPVADAR